MIFLFINYLFKTHFFFFQTLKSKSEISALIEFIEWLEIILKENGKKMAILVCHEVTKFNTSLLIKSLLA